MSERRITERRLLMPVFLAQAATSLLFYLLQYDIQIIGLGLASILGFTGLHLLLVAMGHTGDQYFLPVMAMLTVVGLAMVTRLDPALGFRQGIWVLLGQATLALVIVFGRNLRFWERYQFLYGFLGTGLLLLTLLIGEKAGGARSWLAIGPLRMEPAEGVKILLVLFMAGYLKDNQAFLGRGDKSWMALPSFEVLKPIMVVWGLAVLLLIFQRDLGTALIFYFTFLAMIYAATARSSYLVWGLGAFAAGAVVSYVLFSHLRLRVEVWLNPWKTISGSGYQVAQALFALGGGGILGTGFGVGIPQVMPAVSTDLVFAAIAEELGLAGAAGVVALFLVFATRGFRAALLAKDRWVALLATGLATLLAVQSLVIMGGVTRLLPLTGVPLPLVSYGGSSMLVSYLAGGLLLSASQKGAEA